MLSCFGCSNQQKHNADIEFVNYETVRGRLVELSSDIREKEGSIKRIKNIISEKFPPVFFGKKTNHEKFLNSKLTELNAEVKDLRKECSALNKLRSEHLQKMVNPKR